MNIFYLHEDPYVSAQAMTNKHVVKMILESAQLLSTAHHMLDGDDARHKDKLYKKTHFNHPSAVWVRQSQDNYAWLYSHFLGLAIEYTKRYDKTHKTFEKLCTYLQPFPKNLPVGKFTQPPQAMPDEYKDLDSVKAYRKYYTSEKIKNNKEYLRYKKILKENDK